MNSISEDRFCFLRHLIQVRFKNIDDTVQDDDCVFTFKEYPVILLDNSTDEESDLGRQMKGIRESSPFKRVFDNVRTQICPEEDENTPDNIYYQPDIVDIMAAQYMPLICLWSGLMLGDLQRHKEQSKSDVTRDTNAAVESWMNVVKNRTLGKEIPVRIGLFVREEYKVIKGRLREYLANASMLKAPSKTSKTPTRTKDNEKAEFAKETWQQRSEKKRKQTVYFSPTDKCPGPKEKKKATVQQEIHQASSNKDKKYLPQGFRNTDNICWLISSVQAMAAVSSLNLKGNLACKG